MVQILIKMTACIVDFVNSEVLVHVGLKDIYNLKPYIHVIILFFSKKDIFVTNLSLKYI